MPQPQPRQQSRLNDFQMMQRHVMLKQLQELQRQQQFQELGDSGKQNYINQQSMINKQAFGAQFQPLMNGNPVHDTFSNGLTFSQSQSQDLRSMGLVSQQQLNASLYGTPIASTGNNFSQYSPLQGESRDSINMLTKGNNSQAEKSIMQSSTVSKSFMINHRNDSSNQDWMPDRNASSKPVFQEKNLFGQVPTPDLGNFQQVSSPVHDFGRRQARAYSTDSGPSQGLDSLDPLEQKILFNMDDNSWDPSFGRGNNMERGGSENAIEHTDRLNAFPSVQSGSWSALMQSAVAEASSSDTGQQEEWSGLSSQNPGLSTDNQPSYVLDNGKKHTNWADNNSQRGPLQRLSPLQGAWPVQNFERSESDVHHQSISLYNNSTKPSNNLTGIKKFCAVDINEVAYNDPDSPWRTCHNHVAGSFNDSVVGLEPIKSGKVNQVDDRGNSQLNHFAAVTKLRVDQGIIRGVHQSQELDYNIYDKQGFQRENSIDSYHSNASQHNATGHELRENVWQHESDSQLVAEGNQRPSGQVSRGLSDHNQGYVEQFKLMGNDSYSGIDLEKGCLPDIQRNLKVSEDVPIRRNVGSSVSALYDRPVSFHGPSATTHKSQHMLELLDKVDKATEYRPGMHFGSKGSTSTEVPQGGTPDTSIAQSYNKSSASQCFGLRLAPPSQWLPNMNCFDSSESSPQMGSSTEIFPPGPEKRNQLQNQHELTRPIARQSPQEPLAGEGSKFPAFNPATSQNTSHLNQTNSYGQQVPILEAKPVTRSSITPDMSQNVEFSMRPPNAWTNIRTHQNLPGTQSQKVSFSFLPSPDSTNSSSSLDVALPMNSQGLDYGGDKLWRERSGPQTSMGILDPVSQMEKLSHGQESVPKNLSEANVAAPAPWITRSYQQDFYRGRHSDNQGPDISARDFEAFGCSLKPSRVPPQNYPLLHQAHSLQKKDTDPIRRVSAKYDGVDSNLSVQQVRGDASVNDPEQSLNQDTCQDMVKFGQHVSQNDSISNCMASNISEQSQISLQMAPSWFNHYGMLKNGQMMSMYDARAAKNAAQKFSLGKPSEISAASQVGSVLPTTVTTSVAVTHLPPPYVLPPNVTDQNLAVLRPKKRKISPIALLPWHKEIAQGSQRLPNISAVELEWAVAANRLVEKAENEGEIIEDSMPMYRPRKRIILTTQLMQQLFPPPPAAILLGDATSNYDIVAYFAARLALGGACNVTSKSHMRSDISDMSSVIPKPSERVGNEEYLKFIEDSTNRSKRLEGDFLMLDQRASLLDARVEYEELDKFSIMNRLAKFHSRGSAGATETSTSSGTTLSSPKIFPQRYVKALAMPTTVPEGAHCLSL